MRLSDRCHLRPTEIREVLQFFAIEWLPKPKLWRARPRVDGLVPLSGPHVTELRYNCHLEIQRARLLDQLSRRRKKRRG